MRKFYVILLVLLLVTPLSTAAAIEAQESADALHAEFEQLSAQIQYTSKVVDACEDYQNMLTTGDDGQIDAAAERLFEIMESDISLSSRVATTTLIEAYHKTFSLLLAEYRDQMAENLKKQIPLYFESVRTTDRLTAELELYLSGVSTYPSHSTSKYINDAIDGIPDILYNTTGAENGLIGTVYLARGTVLDTLEDMVETVFISIDGHEVMVSNPVGSLGDVFLALEPNTKYVFPSVGETADLYLTYVGFSGKQDMPAFYLGAHEIFIESLRNPEG